MDGDTICAWLYDVVWWHCKTHCLILILLQRMHTNIMGGADSFVGADNLAAHANNDSMWHICVHVIFMQQRSMPPYPTIVAIIMPMTSCLAATTNWCGSLGQEIPPTSRERAMWHVNWSCDQPLTRYDAAVPTCYIRYKSHVDSSKAIHHQHMHPIEHKCTLLCLRGCVGISG